MLHLSGISKQYGSKILFENADAHLGHRSRTALIGPNGAGKSTLIRIILGLESQDAGTVSRAKHLSIGHLAQEVPKFSGRSVLEEVLRMDGRLAELQEYRAEMEQRFAQAGSAESALHDAELERYGRVLEELENLDEARLEARAKEILGGMGFKPSDYGRSLQEFSGGWLMRVALSRVLLMDPDLLLLDEPTNHLDLESLLWLEDFLRAYRGALLLVSHDRAFLNRMVTEVMEIDQRRLNVYRGNLDAYAAQKSERLAVLRAQYAGQQSKIAEIEAFVERFGAKATKARQAQSRLKQLEKMELIELPDEKSSVRFRFPPAPHSGREVVTLKGAGIQFGEKTVFRNLDWVLPRGKRVAIVGVNGAGKTTLLKLIAGTLAPTQGTVRQGHEVKVGYYAQLQAESLNMNRTIVQELEAVAPDMPISRVRAIAGAFLFTGDAVEKRCAVLSGGEKARVALAKLLLSPSNFLLLDEPTNHLDVESRGVLLDALLDYEGTLCLISHDRDFISPLVDTVLEIQPHPDGSTMIARLGSYDDYVESVEKRLREERRSRSPSLSASSVPATPTSAAPAGTPAARSGPSNNQRRAWEKEREKTEADICRLEKEQSELSDAVANPALYDDKPRLLATLERQRLVAEELSAKLNRWEELSQILDG